MGYRLSEVLSQEAKRSNGKMVIKKVPANKQPTKAVNKKLEKEISIQIKENEAMRHRSWVNANKL